MPCPRCGAGLLRVEDLHDFTRARRRAIFVCGHSLYVDPPPLSPRADPPSAHGTGVCGKCLERFVRRSPFTKLCDACLTPRTRANLRWATAASR